MLKNTMNMIKKIDSKLTEFQRENNLFTWSIWSALYIPLSILVWHGTTAHSYVLGVLATLGSGYATLWICASRWQQLTNRMAADGQELWTVSVNGVCAGKLPDADYARILRSVEFDLRTYIQQLLRAVPFAGRVFVDVVLVVPIIFFWAAAALWLSSPSEFVDALGAMKNVTGQELIIFTVGVFVILRVGALLMSGGLRFACFDDAIASKVLLAIGCPATGKVTLSQFRQGGVYDKFEFIN